MNKEVDYNQIDVDAMDIIQELGKSYKNGFDDALLAVALSEKYDMDISKNYINYIMKEFYSRSINSIPDTRIIKTVSKIEYIRDVISLGFILDGGFGYTNRICYKKEVINKYCKIIKNGIIKYYFINSAETNNERICKALEIEEKDIQSISNVDVVYKTSNIGAIQCGIRFIEDNKLKSILSITVGNRFTQIVSDSKNELLGIIVEKHQ